MIVLTLATVLGTFGVTEGDTAGGVVDPLPPEGSLSGGLDVAGAFTLCEGAEDVPVAAEETTALVAVDEPELEEDEELSGQLRSYSGVLLRVIPTTPKLGLGVSGKASCKVYQNVVICPKTLQPTCSQYVLALAKLATA